MGKNEKRAISSWIVEGNELFINNGAISSQKRYGISNDVAFLDIKL